MPYLSAAALAGRAQALQGRILAKGYASVAPTPVAAWAAVCRACAAAEHVHRQECARRAGATDGAYAMTRQELRWLDNLSRIHQPALAQVSTLTAKLDRLDLRQPTASRPG